MTCQIIEHENSGPCLCPPVAETSLSSLIDIISNLTGHRMPEFWLLEARLGSLLATQDTTRPTLEKDQVRQLLSCLNQAFEYKEDEFGLVSEDEPIWKSYPAHFIDIMMPALSALTKNAVERDFIVSCIEDLGVTPAFNFELRRLDLFVRRD